MPKRKDANGHDEKPMGRRPNIDPSWYRVNHLSKGGEAKEGGLVVKGAGGKQPNMNCRVDIFGQTLKELDDKKRRWVEEMGLQGSFGLVGKRLPRNLCYWLASRVDVASRKLVVPDGSDFPISTVQVFWVLGLPMGSKMVPEKVVDDAMNLKLNYIWEKYGTTSPSGTRGISRSTVSKVVCDAASNEEDFKEAFLMLALMDVLCPTTSHRLSVKLLPAVTVAAEAKNYDWCTLVLDHLFSALCNFGKRFYADGFAKGCGGCTIFLAVVYLDRLRRPPTRWGIWPRLKAWSLSEINKAKSEDESITGDFGKLGCVDVAYGERHPSQGRDSLPVGPFTADEVASFVRASLGSSHAGRSVSHSQFENVEDLCRRKRTYRGKTMTSGSFSRIEVSGDKDEEDGNMSFREVDSSCQEGGSRTGECEKWVLDGDVSNLVEGLQMELSQVDSGRPMSPSTELRHRRTEEEPLDDIRIPMSLDVSKKKRRVRSSAKGIDDFINIGFDHRRYAKKLCSLIMNKGGLSPGVHVDDDEAPILLECDGMYATLQVAATVLKPLAPLDEQYVRVASRLYTKMWALALPQCGRQLMLDPDLSVTDFSDESDVCRINDVLMRSIRFMELYLRQYSRLHMVVMPVGDSRGWWGAIFNFSRSEVIVVDGVESKAASDAHHLELLNLICGLDLVLTKLHKQWASGSLMSWPIRSQQLSATVDSSCTGVHLLLAVKMFVRTSSLFYDNSSFREDRVKLLHDDVFSDCNGAKNAVMRMMKEIDSKSGNIE